MCSFAPCTHGLYFTCWAYLHCCARCHIGHSVLSRRLWSYWKSSPFLTQNYASLLTCIFYSLNSETAPSSLAYDLDLAIWVSLLLSLLLLLLWSLLSSSLSYNSTYKVHTARQTSTYANNALNSCYIINQSCNVRLIQGWVFDMAKTILVRTVEKIGKNRQKLWCSYFISLCLNIGESCRPIL